MKLDITYCKGGCRKQTFTGHVASVAVAARVLATFANPGDFIHVGPHPGFPETKTALWIEGENKRSRPHSAVCECPPPPTERPGFVGYPIAEATENPGWMAQAFLPDQHLQSEKPRIYLYRPDGMPAYNAEHLTLRSTFAYARLWCQNSLAGRDLDLALEALDALELAMCGEGVVAGE